MRKLFVAFLAVGCGSVKENPAGVDSNPNDDAPPAGSTLQVASTGNDANDGVTGPLRTLKRALGIAATNSTITTISMAAGRYDTAAGETFPYTIPDGLSIVGPAGGGAILAGNDASPGLMIAGATLTDLELEHFTTALAVTGTTTLTNLRIRTSTLGMDIQNGANVTANPLDVSNTAGSCKTGVAMAGGASLQATGFGARGLGTVLDIKDTASATLTGAMFMGDAACTTQSVVHSPTSGSLTLTNSVIDGGHIGLEVPGATNAGTVTLSMTTIKNAGNNGVTGAGRTFTMTGGELSGNGRAGLEVFSGTWTFTNAGIKNNAVLGIYIQGNGVANPGTLTMHGCTITGNTGDGVYLFDNAIADLGTAANPGNNTLQNNTGRGLNIDGFQGGRQIDAEGNTWRPNVQSADAMGKYATPSTLAGPQETGNGNNFSINSGWSLRR